jgi:ABC-type transport system involved in multi-copper enzyme maturation permease subunit
MPTLAPILTFARLTIWEASRRKLLLAVLVLTVLVIGATGWAFAEITNSLAGPGGRPAGEVQVRLIASQILILVTFLFAAVLALMSVLVAAPMISGDLESNLALAVLARPVRRSELVLGKWLGMATLVVVYTVGAATMELLVVDIATGYVPPHPLALMVYVSGIGLVLTSVALLLSTRMAGMTAGIIPLICYFVAWVGGILGGFGQAFDNQPLIVTGVVSRLLLPTDGLWRAAVYSMEPATLIVALRQAGPINAANPFAVSDPPAVPFLIWTVAWFVAMVGLTVWSFQHREI